MEKVFASPSKYVQGKSVLITGIAHIKALGVNALLLCDDIVWGIVGEAFNDQLKKENIAVTRVPFNGEASTKEIERVSDIGKTNQSDLVIGLGGGKTISYPCCRCADDCLYRCTNFSFVCYLFRGRGI